MAKPLYLALLFSVVLADAAGAQTSGIAGTTPANPYGAVTLPVTTVTPSTAATAPSGSAVTTSSGGGYGGGTGPSSSAPAASPASGGSSATGTAGRSTSNNVPAWLLCSPSGATGMAPFVTGTNLSCAP